jgi:hypothetical protein
MFHTPLEVETCSVFKSNIVAMTDALHKSEVTHMLQIAFFQNMSNTIVIINNDLGCNLMLRRNFDKLGIVDNYILACMELLVENEQKWILKRGSLRVKCEAGAWLSEEFNYGPNVNPFHSLGVGCYRDLPAR